MESFKPKKTEKEIISIRIDREVLEQIDNSAASTDISRNEMINQCIDFALLHLDKKDNEN